MKPFRPEFGVFETMRTYGHDIFKLDEHLERLSRSAEIVYMELPKSLADIRSQIESEVSQYDGTFPVRIRVVATTDDVIVEIYPLKIDNDVFCGVSATCMEVMRDHPEAKAFPYDKSTDAHDEATRLGHYEALLVDDRGYVREGAYSNLFWVKDGTIFTTDRQILRGVTRQVVIDLVSVSFAEVTPEDLYDADEVFITKTTTGVVPITQIDGHVIGGNQVGPVAEKLKLHFLEFEREAE